MFIIFIIIIIKNEFTLQNTGENENTLSIQTPYPHSTNL